MPRDSHSTAPQGISIEFGAALLITLANICLVLSLPCFPSTDGPMHMYFVRVFGQLLAHHASPYTGYYAIRHLLPPYSLYYYALLGLSRVVPMLLADRLILCGYFVSFLFGFRYLARAIGPWGDSATLMASLLLLNWPLGMGFANFCLALSLAFWATGLWLRLAKKRGGGIRVRFLTLVTATMLTHPVPLLLCLLVTGFLLCVNTLQRSRSAGIAPAHAVRKCDLLLWLLACLNLAYVKIFTKANPLHQAPDAVASSWTAQYLARFSSYYGREHAMAFLLGQSPAILMYRAGLLAILLGSAALAFGQLRRNRRQGTWSNGDSFLLLGGASFLLLPLLPSQLNGSYYFADRLVLCVWLCFLLAGAGWNPPIRAGAKLRPVLVLGALGCNACLLFAANRLLQPPAANIAAVDKLTIAPAGQVGLLLEDVRPESGSPREGLAWNPYTWALAHAFRHNDAVLADPPWMDVTILPVGPAQELPQTSIETLDQPYLVDVEKNLLKSPADIQRALTATSFLLVDQLGRQPLLSDEPLLQAAGPAATAWSCVSHGWYRACSRQPARLVP